MKLLLGGSPCTHWSIAQCKGREIKPEGMGWELFKNYLVAREKYRPDYFLYENNKSMSVAIRAQISKELGVEPILINSALVSAQNRQRLYWTNIPGVELPQDRGLLLRDILDSGLPLRDKGYTLKASYSHDSVTSQYVDDGHFPANGAAEPVNVTVNGKAQCLRATCYKDGIRNMVGNSVDKRTCVAVPVHIHQLGSFYGQHSRWGIFGVDGKSPCLTASAGMGGGHIPMYPIPVSIEWADGKTYPIHEVRNGHITLKGTQYPVRLCDGLYIIRKLSVRECMRLQTVPEAYRFPVSNSQAYKMLGNGWTVDVVAHILSYCPGITNVPIEVLSMYDGMSCGHLALDKLEADVACYYATEIDKFAIRTTLENYPGTVQLGDAFQVRDDGWKL